MTLELQATPEEVMRAVEQFQEFARSHEIPERTAFGLALAIEECGSNIVNHALQRDTRQKFVVKIEHTGTGIVIELRDRGPEFDPTTIRGRKLQAEDDDLPGGWGIELVRRYTDGIRYTRAGEENILELTKRLDQSPDKNSLS